MKVTICVNYTLGPRGGCEMLCKDTELVTAPVVGDEIEVLPEDDSDSAAHHRVERRYVLTDHVEVHTPLQTFAPGDIDLLREHGYRHPGE